MSNKHLWAAYLKAKTEFPSIFKNKEGVHNNGYADLGEILSKIEPILIKYGLVVHQNPLTENDRTGMETTLVHCETGETHTWRWVPEKSILGVNQKGIQAAGSIVSYLRRYHQEAIFNLKAKDNDGEDTLEPKAASKPLSDGQVKRLYAIINATGRDDKKVVEWIKEQAKIEHINQLTKDQYDFFCQKLEEAGMKASEQQQLEERPY
jgi:hypothetical protein